MPKPILHTIESGGSGTGQSYYKAWTGCPRYAHLKYEEKVSEPESKALVVGTIFHAFAHLHETRGKKSFNPSAVEFSQTSGETLKEEWRLEAERVFKQYRDACPPGTWGEFVSAEEPILDYTIEGFPVTVQPDLVVYISKTKAKQLSARFNCVITAGYWIIDYKTSAWKTQVEPYVEDVQPWLYQMAWNWKHPDKAVQGALMVIVTKTKEVKIEVGVVPKVKAYHETVVSRFIRLAVFMKLHARDLAGVPYTAPNRCFSYGRACSYKGGACERV